MQLQPETPELNQLSRRILDELAETMLAGGAQQFLSEKDLRRSRTELAMLAARGVIDRYPARLLTSKILFGVACGLGALALVSQLLMAPTGAALGYSVLLSIMLGGVVAFSWHHLQNVRRWEPSLAQRLEKSGLIEKLASSPESLLTIHDHVPRLLGTLFLGARQNTSRHAQKLLLHNLDWYLCPPRRLFRLSWLSGLTVPLVLLPLVMMLSRSSLAASAYSFLLPVINVLMFLIIGGQMLEQLKKNITGPYIMLYFGERLYGLLEDENPD